MSETTSAATYEPSAIEAAVQAAWAAGDVYRVTEDPSRPKYYACSMLPYPSGKLHMGHVRNYTINDMLARQLRMKGYNVLMPMGWDAFGLPAENAAMKNGVPPAQWTYQNIAHMKGQMKSMGLAIDWSREMAACDPGYYKWNQWFFLKLLEKGIAYRKTQIVNWDPVDQTVLANEQVIDGKGWRTGAVVEKREIPGYYLKITDYAQELLDAVADPASPQYLSGWPERVRAMQEHWIGKSEGVRFAFSHDIRGADGSLVQGGRMFVFTTRADTIMGVTFCAVAPEHPLAVRAGELNPALTDRINALKAGGTTEAELAVKEKEGVDTGLTVTHPLSGEQVPLWVGNYVLINYGDGAVMGVPAHDERDLAFATKYGLEVRQVVAPDEGEFRKEFSRLQAGGEMADPGPFDGVRARSLRQSVLGEQISLLNRASFDPKVWKDWYASKTDGVAVNSGKYDGLSFKACVDAVAADLAKQASGEKKTTWRLRDWGISRQRYWGTPIPIVHCDEHGAQPVPFDQLPVVLPEDCVPDGSGNPLHQHEGFLRGATCPICGKAAKRETDTMDTFADSSWYFIRYCLPEADQAASKDMTNSAVNYWMPKASAMDQYIGGIEHAILHLLYARFWTKAMRDMGLVQMDEPFTKLLCQGMVLNHIFSRKTDNGGKEFHWPHDVEFTHDSVGKINGAQLKHAVGELPAGTPITYEGVGTMSKSKNNGVDPQSIIDQYGADTARLYTMFTAPPEATLEWNDQALEGGYRFLKRVFAFASKCVATSAMNTGALVQNASKMAFSKAAKSLRFEIHSIFKQIDYDYGRMQYNTVVSGTMKLLNALEGFKAADAADGAALTEGVSLLLRSLYPVCPHIACHLWHQMGFEAAQGSLLDAPWPVVDEAALQQDEIELMLQVNGKLRGSIHVAADADKATIEAAALASPAFMQQSAGQSPKKVIVVPGRLVNVVV